MGRKRAQATTSTTRSPSAVPRPRAQAAAAPRRAECAPEGYFEHTPDAVLILDDKGRIVEANPAAVALTGFSRSALRRRNIASLCPATDDDGSGETFAAFIDAGGGRSDRLLRCKDGRRVPIEVRIQALPNGTWLAVARDVPGRTQGERDAAPSAEAFHALVTLCHAAVVSTSPNGRITSWNPAAEVLFAYSASEALGMSLTKLMPARVRRQHLPAFQKMMRSDCPVALNRTIETYGRKKSGAEFPIEVSVTAWREDGRASFTALVRDLTEQREVVERLNDALQRLQFHVERMPLAYIVFDPDFRVLEWNPAAERMFQFTRAEAVGTHAYDLIVPSSVHATVNTVWADLLRGDTSSHSINENVRKDGSRLTCEWFNTPLRDSAGRIRGIASMAMDVSERETLEAQLRHTQRLESLGVLAGGIAHDFNSSLMVILGNSALLRSMKQMPAPALDHLEAIEAAGSRANELIKHLLAYARTGRHNPQPTNLNDILRDTLSFVRSSVGLEHELRLSLARDLPKIRADSSQIQQIVLNLCMNAKQAMANGGVVGVTTRRVQLTPARAAKCVPHTARPGSYVELLVTDRGCGMDEATRAHIFDPFFTTKPDGHGLGLAAALGILRQHEATILVESTPGKGTKMHVYFPIYRGRAKPPPRARRQAGTT